MGRLVEIDTCARCPDHTGRTEKVEKSDVLRWIPVCGLVPLDCEDPIAGWCPLPKAPEVPTEGAKLWPYVSLQPSMMGGQPCIGTHRLKVEVFAGCWWNGTSLKTLSGCWPEVTRADILVCCWYEARYHLRRTHSRAWREWLEANEGKIGLGDFDAVPMPPQKGEGDGGTL